MSQHDYSIANQTGQNFRSDLNDALAAIVTLNSGATEPTTTYAFQLWADTTAGQLKIRNAANSDWIVVGTLASANLGLLSAAGGTLTGALRSIAGAVGAPGFAVGEADTGLYRQAAGVLGLVAAGVEYLRLSSAGLDFRGTGAAKINVGTSAQRPGTPADGMLRFNSDLNTFEGYRSGAWGAIGGGGFVIASTASVTAGGTITVGTNDNRQLIPVAGSGGPVGTSTTPFGGTGGWRDGTEVLLVGTSDANSVTLTYNDAAKGVVGNFSSVELARFRIVALVYSSSLDRWIVTGGI